MDFNIEVRKKQLQSLDQYITSSKDKVQSILDYIDWNSKKVIEKEPEVICSVNPSHTVTVKSTDSHLKKCFIKSSGYHSDDDFLSDPINDSLSSIQIDHSKKFEVFNKARENNQRFRTAWNGQDSDPMTSDRLFTTFSTDERLALYDYCIQNTKPPPVPTEFNMQIEDKKEEKFLTEEELLAKERDAKRRRIKYKSVHTGRKNHTEIIRELIDNQMEQYRDFLRSDLETNSLQSNVNDQINEQNLYRIGNDSSTCNRDGISDTERPSSSISRHSNHSGSSRSKNDKLYKNHSYDSDYKGNPKDYEKRYDYGKYDCSHKEYRRHKGSEDDYKNSREKRYHKLERRH